MELLKDWAPANELATAVEARQSSTLKFLEEHFYDSHNWLLYQDSLGKHLGWTLEERVDHVFMKIRKAEVVRLGVETNRESGPTTTA